MLVSQTFDHNYYSECARPEYKKTFFLLSSDFNTLLNSVVTKATGTESQYALNRPLFSQIADYLSNSPLRVTAVVFRLISVAVVMFQLSQIRDIETPASKESSNCPIDVFGELVDTQSNNIDVKNFNSNKSVVETLLKEEIIGETLRGAYEFLTPFGFLFTKV